jgi:predicted RNase H-like HicB family nuclease
VAECVEIAVVIQGATLDETVANLREAVHLHLEGENLADFGLAPNPTLAIFRQAARFISEDQLRPHFYTN